MSGPEQKKIYIEIARREYGNSYQKIKWITGRQAEAAAEERGKLLLWIQERGAQIGCGGTKPFFGSLSPGCRLCTAGEWSCLFINNICNGRCFFCPTDQSDLDEPTTQTIPFTDPRDYTDYLEKFGFKGVSMSGGEPLLSLDRTIGFTSAVKKRFGRDVHIWLYTNGILLDRDKLMSLKESGIGEIRFNIYASNDHLNKIRIAQNYIRDVTVEIPALPEHLEKLKDYLSELKQAGVKFLNLHQLRLTPHNFPHFAERDYTYLPGPKITVIESELAALKIMKFNIESGINLPINYCSFPYKNRYQKKAERSRHSPHIMKPYEELTEAGMIRSMLVKGRQGRIDRQGELLKKTGVSKGSWELSPQGDSFYFNQECLRHLDFTGLSLKIRYYDAAIRPTVSYRNVFKEIRLNGYKKVVIERWPVSDEIELVRNDISHFRSKYLLKETANEKGNNVLKNLEGFEFLPKGLSPLY